MDFTPALRRLGRAPRRRSGTSRGALRLHRPATRRGARHPRSPAPARPPAQARTHNLKSAQLHTQTSRRKARRPTTHKPRHAKSAPCSAQSQACPRRPAASRRRHRLRHRSPQPPPPPSQTPGDFVFGINRRSALHRYRFQNDSSQPGTAVLCRAGPLQADSPIPGLTLPGLAARRWGRRQVGTADEAFK